MPSRSHLAASSARASRLAMRKATRSNPARLGWLAQNCRSLSAKTTPASGLRSAAPRRAPCSTNPRNGTRSRSVAYQPAAAQIGYRDLDVLHPGHPDAHGAASACVCPGPDWEVNRAGARRGPGPGCRR
jgi:hypothetical protein